MSQPYTPEFKKKIVRLHEEEGRTIESIMSEYGIAKLSCSSWSRWLSKYENLFGTQRIFL